MTVNPNKVQWLWYHQYPHAKKYVNSLFEKLLASSLSPVFEYSNFPFEWKEANVVPNLPIKKMINNIQKLSANFLTTCFWKTNL